MRWPLLLSVLVPMSLAWNAMPVSFPNLPENFRPDDLSIPEAPVAEPVPCNGATFKRCVNALCTSLGYNSSRVDEFLRFLEERIGPDYHGLSSTCPSIRAFEACLGEEAAPCVSLPALERNLNASRAWAWQVYAAYRQFTTECRPDVAGPLETHRDCFKLISNLRGRTVRACFNNFTRDYNSTSPLACATEQTFVRCVGEVYKPCGAATQRAICWVYSLSVDVNQCNTDCDFETPITTPATEPCNSHTFKRCLSRLSSRLGYKASSSDPNREVGLFEKFINDRIGEDFQGIASTCAAVRDFKACLGGEAASCFSLSALRRNLNVTTEWAIQAYYGYRSFLTECRTDVAGPLGAQRSCYNHVATTQHPALQACFYRLQEDYRPDSPTACTTFQAFFDCEEKFFQPCGAAFQTAFCRCQLVQLWPAFNGSEHCSVDCEFGPNDVATTPAVPAPEPGPCLATDLKGCVSEFLHSVGFHEYSATGLQAYLLRWFAADPSNFRRLCTAQADMDACLGGERCWAVGALEAVGISQTEAEVARGLYAVFAFECQEDVLHQLVQHSDCLAQANLDPEVQVILSGCTRLLRSGHRPLCATLDDYDACASDVYASRCGAELRPLLCRVYAAAAAANAPQCRLSC